MQINEQAIWPLHKLHFEDQTRSCVFDARHAEFELEEYDSEDKNDSEQLLILDCLGRQVSILLNGDHVFEYANLKTGRANPEHLELLSTYELVPCRTTWGTTRR